MAKTKVKLSDKFINVPTRALLSFVSLLPILPKYYLDKNPPTILDGVLRLKRNQWRP